jgi:hypothetical protein
VGFRVTTRIDLPGRLAGAGLGLGLGAHPGGGMRIIWPCSTVRGRAQDGKSADGVVNQAAMVVAWIVGALALSTSCPGGPDDRAGEPGLLDAQGLSRC